MRKEYEKPVVETVVFQAEETVMTSVDGSDIFASGDIFEEGSGIPGM